MASELDVINACLADLGQEPVTDLSSASLGQSSAALKLTRQLDQARDVVLRRHGWCCALEYLTLQPATIAGYANWKFPYVYLLPAGSLRVWQIQACCWSAWSEDAGVGASCPNGSGSWGEAGLASGRERWETGTIDTDIGARLIIRSIQGDGLSVAHVRTPSWAAIDAHVADAIAAELSRRACRTVTGSAATSDDVTRWQERIALAISVDGTQADSASRGPSRLHLTRLWAGG